MSERKYWLDDPRNVKKIVWTLAAACVVLLLVELFIDKHAHYAFEGWWGFFGIYGFLGCLLLVLTAKQLRKLLMRPEDYYDE